MEQVKEWIAGDVPPDEGYWKALLRDGENGRAAPVAIQVLGWEETNTDATGKSTSAESATFDGQWEEARLAMEQGKIIELPVVGYNRGGVLIGWDGLCGFVPASHLVALSPHASEEERHSELRRLVGSRLCLRIIELDPQQRRFVLSERATRFDETHRQESLDALCPGDVRQGIVTNLCSFGAFVDLGGVEGLIHISELSWSRIGHPSDILKPGQPIKVYILNVDREHKRVGLSTKRLQLDPWQIVADRYQVGQIIESTITHVVDFGAFARVEEGVEGLIHISELAEGNFIHPRNVVREGDVVTALILSIDKERRRMGLSLRQV
ncbi:MAG: S1 RNA-binding domain-containing protein [Chloroflexi bacterium]|nr:S1 RNA-binding domain-containing protein [Chloroflexota bacterium]